MRSGFPTQEKSLKVLKSQRKVQKSPSAQKKLLKIAMSKTHKNGLISLKTVSNFFFWIFFHEFYQKLKNQTTML